MGEYLLTPNGKLKLGVMDDLRYVRHQELVSMAETPEGRLSPDVGRALEDTNTLYRFPFPSEDGQDWSAIGQRNMFRPVVILDADGIEIEHRSVVKCITAPGGNYQVNVYLPCPFLLTTRGKPEDPTKTALCSTLPPPSIMIFGERVQDGKPRTIFSCIYCERMFSLTDLEIQLLRLQNQKHVDAHILDRLAGRL